MNGILVNIMDVSAFRVSVLSPKRYLSLGVWSGRGDGALRRLLTLVLLLAAWFA